MERRNREETDYQFEIILYMHRIFQMFKFSFLLQEILLTIIFFFQFFILKKGLLLFLVNTYEFLNCFFGHISYTKQEKGVELNNTHKKSPPIFT